MNKLNEDQNLKYHVGCEIKKSLKKTEKCKPTLVIDKLIIRVKIKDDYLLDDINQGISLIFLSENFFLRVTNYNSLPVYDLVYKHMTREIGTLSITHNDKKNITNEATLEFRNQIFYEEDGFDLAQFIFVDLVDYIEYKSVRYIEIAYDTNEDLVEIIPKIHNSKLYKLIRPLKLLPYNDGHYLGSMKSDKYICFYHKGKRLEKENKQYIKRFWKANGLDTESPITRFELRLQNKATVPTELDFYRLYDISYLSGLMQKELANFARYKYVGQSKQKPKRIHKLLNANYEIDFLDLGNFKPNILEKRILPKRREVAYAKKVLNILVGLNSRCEPVTKSKLILINYLLNEFKIFDWYHEQKNRHKAPSKKSLKRSISGIL